MSRLVALLVLALASAAGADSTTIWSTTIDSDVRWWHLTRAGTFVLGTEGGVLGLDGDTGREIWRLADLRSPGDLSLDADLPEPFALLRLKRGMRGDVMRILLDTRTGTEVWNSTQLGLEQVHNHVFLWPIDAVLVAGERREGKPKKVLVAADLATGRSLWTLDAGEKDPRGLAAAPRLFGPDSTLYVAFEKRLRKFDLRTGKQIWRSEELGANKWKPRFVPANQPPGAPEPQRSDPRWLPPHAWPWPSRDGERIIVAVDSRLQCVDLRTGRLVWDEPPLFSQARCVSFAVMDEGVLARTMPEYEGNDELLLVDEATGKIRWRYPDLGRSPWAIAKSAVGSWTYLSDPVLGEGSACLFAGGDLLAIDLATGKATKRGEIGFAAPEAPVQLERSGDGFLAVGSQDIEWLDAEGRSVRHLEFMAPYDLEGALLYASLATTFNAIGRMDLGGFYVKGNYAPAWERFMTDYHATTSRRGYVFMLAEVDAGSMLVAVDKASGETVLQTPISKRDPSYGHDAERGRLIVRKGNDMLCLRLP